MMTNCQCRFSYVLLSYPSKTFIRQWPFVAERALPARPDLQSSSYCVLLYLTIFLYVHFLRDWYLTINV